MKKQWISVLVGIMLLMLGSLACSLGSKLSKTSYLGEEVRNPVGGFTYKKVIGYSVTEDISIVNMTAPDATMQSGPWLTLLGGLMDIETTNEELLEGMRAQGEGIVVGSGKKFKVDGVNGLLADLSGEYLDVEIQGKMYVAMVEPKQQFVMLGLAPKARWEEISPIFDELLSSVTFFEAEEYTFDVAAPEPTTVVTAVVQATPTEIVTEEVVVVVTEAPQPQVIRQWAVDAYASSEYSSTEWSAKQAIGEPNVFACEDNPYAWASLEGDTEEYLVLDYEIPVIPTELVIYQSYNPSQVVQIQFIDTEDQTWVLWSGEPEEVQDCPDAWTHTIELEEPFYAKSVAIFVDQSVMGWGWVEIDAVELVGYPEGTQPVAPIAGQPTEAPAPTTAAPTQAPVSEEVPTNYDGWMAGPVYQGYLNVKINETPGDEIASIMPIEGKLGTDSWKPRADHAQTYVYETNQDGMTMYFYVATDGIVYRKSITANKFPKDYQLTTVTRANYEILDGIYKKDYVIPYPVMANLLNSPGFLRESYYRPDDQKLIALYEWYSTDNYVMSGYFLNGRLTGMAGLVYRPLE